MPLLVAAVVTAVVAAVVTAVALASAVRRRTAVEIDGARAHADGVMASARLEAAAARRAVETEARSEALARRTTAFADLAAVETGLDRRLEQALRADADLRTELDELDQRAAALDTRAAEI